MKRILTVAALFMSVVSFAQFVGTGSFEGKKRTYLDDGAWAPRERNVDFKHMRLEVSFETSQGLVKGKVTHRFSPLRDKVDSIWLDGVDMRILDATINGKAAKTRVEQNGLWVFTGRSLPYGETDSMTVVYECNPRRGLYFIGWNDPSGMCRKQIWSQGQGIDNRNWIPFYDEMNDKITTEMIVTMQSEYKVLSNGAKLKEKDNKNGTKTWYYKMSHQYAPYLVMLGIGDYQIEERKSKSGVPLHLYYYPDWKDRVQATYQYSEDMIDFFESEIGVKYPWESYSQIPVQDFMYGAMENTTATVYGDFLMVDERSNWDRAYVGVNAHELAHQWFGDYVTAKSDAHHWLQESFATYYNQMYERKVYGNDYFDWARRDAQNGAVNESKKNLLQVAHSQAGSVRHYPKGAFVLNMLKYVVGGRDAYNRSVKLYLEQHAYSNVTSEDLMNAFNESTGMSLNWFWDEWIYKGGEPSYNVTAKDINENGKRSTQIYVEQVQEMNDVVGLFKMPIWFEVHYTDGTSEKKMEWIEEKSTFVSVPNAGNKTVAYVLFDPNNEILKSVTFTKPVEWLKNQALDAPNMLDRYDAITAMRDLSYDQKREILIKAFNQPNNAWHGIRGEIATQLMNDANAGSVAVVAEALKSDPWTQRDVLNSTPVIASDKVALFEGLLTGKSYDNVMNSLDKLCTQYPANAQRYLDATKGVIGTSGRNVEVKRLEITARILNDQASKDKLVAYTGMSYEFRTRVNAAQALKRLNYFVPALMDNLTDAMVSSNTRLANPSGEVLDFFYSQAQYRPQIAEYVQKKSWKEWERETIGKMLH
jgi:aminopeptidase N